MSDKNILVDELGITTVKAKTQAKHSHLFQVIMLNDDYTPMDFTIETLMLSFNMTQEKAEQKMLEVHREGKGLCGVYTKDIAETKIAQVKKLAVQHEHPLLCKMEKF